MKTGFTTFRLALSIPSNGFGLFLEPTGLPIFFFLDIWWWRVIEDDGPTTLSVQWSEEEREEEDNGITVSSGST